MKLKTTRPVVIDYLGTFYPDEEYAFSEYDVAYYENATGMKLVQENMPKGVTLTSDGKSKTNQPKEQETK